MKITKIPLTRQKVTINHADTFEIDAISQFPIFFLRFSFFQPKISYLLAHTHTQPPMCLIYLKQESGFCHFHKIRHAAWHDVLKCLRFAVNYFKYKRLHEMKWTTKILKISFYFLYQCELQESNRGCRCSSSRRCVVWWVYYVVGFPENVLKINFLTFIFCHLNFSNALETFVSFFFLFQFILYIFAVYNLSQNFQNVTQVQVGKFVIQFYLSEEFEFSFVLFFTCC